MQRNKGNATHEVYAVGLVAGDFGTRFGVISIDPLNKGGTDSAQPASGGRRRNRHDNIYG
jgi:hypothetical protein